MDCVSEKSKEEKKNYHEDGKKYFFKNVIFLKVE